jgi:hypothetical protein
MTPEANVFARPGIKVLERVLDAQAGSFLGEPLSHASISPETAREEKRIPYFNPAGL